MTASLPETALQHTQISPLLHHINRDEFHIYSYVEVHQGLDTKLGTE